MCRVKANEGMSKHTESGGTAFIRPVVSFETAGLFVSFVAVRRRNGVPAISIEYE